MGELTPHLMQVSILKVPKNKIMELIFKILSRVEKPRPLHRDNKIIIAKLKNTSTTTPTLPTVPKS